METVISGVIVLCMFYQGGIIEHTYIQDQKMSSCLKAKRQVERSVNPENVRMQCGKVDASCMVSPGNRHHALVVETDGAVGLKPSRWWNAKRARKNRLGIHA